jgi:ATP-binding cassette subfamily C (CFTR/MRP) protein 1
LQVSRQLRYLDLESRSPLYSHFLETLEGLPTIRAFGWEERFIETNILRLDYSQKPFYMLFCVQKWLSLVLDMMAAAMAVLVVGLAINFRQLTDTGLLGVSMNSVMGMSCRLHISIRLTKF